MKEPAKRRMVNLAEQTKLKLDLQLTKINKKRVKANKLELTRGEFIDLAIDNVTVDMGLEK